MQSKLLLALISSLAVAGVSATAQAAGPREKSGRHASKKKTKKEKKAPQSAPRELPGSVM